MSLGVALFAASMALASGVESSASSLPQRFEEGTALFDAGQYAGAAEIFAELHRQVGDPGLLYPLAQSLRLAGRCVEALAAYRSFVDASADLRSRAAKADSQARIERLTVDLNNASARLVQMRTCIGRLGGGQDRAASRMRKASGDAQGAIASLSQVWEQTRDPTILPELAEWHRSAGNCTEAQALLDLAVSQLGALEAITGDGAEDLDLTAGRAALGKARALLAGPACSAPQSLPRAQEDSAVVRTTATLTASSSLANAPAGPPPVRLTQIPHAATSHPGWYPWAVGGLGGAIILAGAVCFWKDQQIQHELESQGNDTGRFSSGQAYYRAGIGLSGLGGALVVGAAVYAWATHERSSISQPVIGANGDGVVAGWVFGF